MTAYVALLRAVNVGGAGALPMSVLKATGEACGFDRVRTYIASGNLLFASDSTERQVKAALESRLARSASKPIGVFVRSGTEIDSVVAANPFPDAHGSRHMVFFYDEPPAGDLPARCRDRSTERIALVGRELHVDYGDAIRSSRLKIPDALARTARNMNTVRKLSELLAGGD